MVQRTHGLVAGQKFFHGSGTGLAPGTIQVPRDISVENVSSRRISAITAYVSYYHHVKMVEILGILCIYFLVKIAYQY